MSYTNPKYTYKSNQPAFDKLTNASVNASRVISDKIAAEELKKDKQAEKDKLLGEQLQSAANGVSSTFIRNSMGASPKGRTDIGKGVIGNWYKGKGQEVSNLVMATSGPNRSCETTGDCEELQKRLGFLQNSPGTISEFTSLLLSELNWRDMQNFDESQNPQLLAVANMLTGVEGFSGEGTGYSYKLEEAKGGNGFNYVFTGPEDVFPGGEYIINSNDLESITSPANGGSLFETTQSATDNTMDVITASGIISNGNMNEKGVYVSGGSFDNSKYIKDVGDQSSYEIVSIDPKTRERTYRVVIDEDLIKKDLKINGVNGDVGGISQALAANFGFGGQGKLDTGQIRTYWNKVLLNKNSFSEKLNNYDDNELREIFGNEPETLESGKPNPKYRPIETLRTAAKDLLTKNWSTKDELTEDQLAIFKEMYLLQQVEAVRNQMQNHPSAVMQYAPIDYDLMPNSARDPEIILDNF